MLRITIALSLAAAALAACDTLPVGTPDDLAAAPVLPPPPPTAPSASCWAISQAAAVNKASRGKARARR